MKRRLYREGALWSNYANATRRSSTNGVPREFNDAQGFPLPMFIIRAVMGKLGLQLKEPPSIGYKAITRRRLFQNVKPEHSTGC
ncbi:hypothetical protein MRX96_054356 [Rhipicephalus microplus]